MDFIVLFIFVAMKYTLDNKYLIIYNIMWNFFPIRI